jgi:hypothetical protein
VLILCFAFLGDVVQFKELGQCRPEHTICVLPELDPQVLLPCVERIRLIFIASIPDKPKPVVSSNMKIQLVRICIPNLIIFCSLQYPP